ncbi:MAG: family 10 glycosylhydrolase [Ruminococcus sp.]|nr:family 10 glycosylhydrolase [Ruminococcus sp.]
MKKLFVFTMCVLFTSCAVAESQKTAEKFPPPSIQTEEQLHIDGEKYTPVNYENQVGMWFPYMHFEEYMFGKTEEEFTSAVREKFSSALEESVNTVYLHIRPCGDSYYKSEIFPVGVYLDGDYDPLKIMIDEAHAVGISVHAWINPLRCQTVEQMSDAPENFIVKKWTEDSDCHFAEIVGNRWYLNPAYDETVNLICEGVDEIIKNYNVDGVHIDDYFYPTTDADFDAVAFENSGYSDLTLWRTENCTHFVKAIYDTVKNYDERILFGISPQGNIEADYNSQYADVRLWGSEKGYCDYIVPQIYFGFNNETCPFVPTLAEWESLVTCEDVSLVVGLGAYKQGQKDVWAGISGENEWAENDDVIARQIEIVRNSTADGYALYY